MLNWFTFKMAEQMFTSPLTLTTVGMVTVTNMNVWSSAQKLSPCSFIDLSQPFIDNQENIQVLLRLETCLLFPSNMTGIRCVMKSLHNLPGRDMNCFKTPMWIWNTSTVRPSAAYFQVQSLSKSRCQSSAYFGTNRLENIYQSPQAFCE